MSCIISDGPSAVVMMFTYKEVIEKLEKKLTDPKYHEVLMPDDDEARQRREQKRLEKEKDKQKEQERANLHLHLDLTKNQDWQKVRNSFRDLQVVKL